MARTGARETLDAARDAALEARRARRMLAVLDEDERGGRTFAVVRAHLLTRLDLDRQAIDAGRAIIDAMEGAGTADGWVLDAMRARYLDGMEWDEVGEVVCYSGRHAQRMVGAALDTPMESES